MDLTVEDVYDLLIRSRLVGPADAQALFERWRAKTRHKDNPERFLRFLVDDKVLTPYQAGLLKRGHGDGFFLDEYKILDRVGKGRMAGVYKAEHRLGQEVAVKVLPPSKARDRHVLERFHREARLALQLKHPNVVRAFQLGLAGGLHYLVMEYLEGETLEEVLLRRGPLPVAEAAQVIHQALLGLQHFHEKGLVHRDLKPANLMLVPVAEAAPLNAAVKILDIGLARSAADPADDGDEPSPDPGLTAAGSLLGTPDYMSPEQARDPRKVDTRSDIYSLGCVLYHALSGQPPFPDGSLINQMMRHANEPPRPLADHNPEVPDGLQQIVNWMMAKDPAERYPTPERAAQALSVFLAADTGSRETEVGPQMRSYLSWLELQPGTGEHQATPAEPLAAGLPPLDVELLPPPRPVRSRAAPAWHLTRRDFVMLALGGFGVLVALLAGKGIATWLSPNR